MTRKKVCVIGAGLGGLSTGLFLSKKGYAVTVFEKEELIGGRALSLNGNDLTLKDYKKILSKYSMAISFSEPPLKKIFKEKMLKDYRLDLGFHSIGGGEMSEAGRVVFETGSEINIIGTRLGLVRRNGYKFPLLNLIDKLIILPQILRLYSYNEKTMKQLDTVSIADTIKKYDKKKLTFVLELLPRVITTVNNLNKISTGESFRANQLNIKRGSSPVGYPVGGLDTINNALVQGIESNGGRILLNHEVKEIIVEKGSVTGVKIKDKTFDSNLVIYNGLVQNLFQIVNEKNFSKKYVKYIKSLKGTGSLCAYYSLNNIPYELTGKSFLFIEKNADVDGDDAVGMIEFVTADPKVEVAPKSAYLVQSYIICTPNEAKSKKMLTKLKKILDKNLDRLIPNYKNQLNWAIYPTVWHLDGVAKTIDNKKPDIKTPIEGLYLVGDCTKAPGIGINCAINSAKILCNEILY